MKRLVMIAGMLLIAATAEAQYLCPDGSYVGRGPCQIAPNGRYVQGDDGRGVRIAPDGTYTSGQPRIAPDGSYVGGRGRITIAPDGTYVGGQPRLAPNGKYVGVDDD